MGRAENQGTRQKGEGRTKAISPFSLGHARLNISVASGFSRKAAASVKIRRLPPRNSPLQMPAERFRAAGHRLVDQIAALLESIPERPVTRDESPSAVREALSLDGPLPEAGEAAAMLDSTWSVSKSFSAHC